MRAPGSYYRFGSLFLNYLRRTRPGKTVFRNLFEFNVFFTSFCTQNPFLLQNIGPGEGSDLHFIAIQPDNPDVIYVGGDIEGIFKTIDGGTSWQNINNNPTQLPYGGDVYWTNDIVIDPVNYQRIYFCSGAGLFRSENGGQSWNLLYPKQYNPEKESIEV